MKINKKISINRIIFIISSLHTNIESHVRQQHNHNRQQKEQQEWLTSLYGKLFDIPYADLVEISLPCDSLELEFTDLQLGQMKRTPDMDIMDEKYALQFRCSITIQNNPTTFNVNQFIFLNEKKKIKFYTQSV